MVRDRGSPIPNIVETPPTCGVEVFSTPPATSTLRLNRSPVPESSSRGRRGRRVLGPDICLRVERRSRIPYPLRSSVRRPPDTLAVTTLSPEAHCRPFRLSFVWEGLLG